MLLNDIGNSSNATFRRINQYLELNYGLKIAENTSDEDLVLITEQVQGEITELKIKGDDARCSPEISKRLLILEGIKYLREFAMVAQFQSPDLDHVVNGMAEFVVHAFRISGTTQMDFDEAVRDAMKQYRSSKYRFPDEMIENRVREMALNKIHSPDLSEAMLEEEEIDMKTLDLEEDGMWGSLGKRANAFGGHAASVPDTPEAKRKMQALDNPSLSLADQPKSNQSTQVPMIKDKNGRMVQDPFAANVAARKQGIAMKENLVKNLRKLLETEVSQAEVMMAAKGFAQELQEMVEKIGRLQNEDLPPVTDQMRETYGTESASAFQTQIYGALQGVMDSLYTAKGQVDDAVQNMATTGQVSASIDMDKDVDGMDPSADMDSVAMDDPGDLDLDNISSELDSEDDFGGAEAEEPLGRAKKMESAESLQKKVFEMKKLVERARRLKESAK